MPLFPYIPTLTDLVMGQTLMSICTAGRAGKSTCSDSPSSSAPWEGTPGLSEGGGGMGERPCEWRGQAPNEYRGAEPDGVNSPS